MKHLSLTGIDRQTEDDDLLDYWCLDRHEIYSDSIDQKRIVGQFAYDKDFHAAAAKITSQAFYSILPILSEKLNQKCSKNLPDKFWEILVGAWLRQYLDVLYQRFEQLKAFPIKNYSVLLIGENDEDIPLTSDDFSVMLMQDKLNHQLLGQIIVEENLCAHSFFKTVNTFNVSKKVGRRIRNPWVLKIAGLISAIITKNASSVICNSYMSKQMVHKGILKKFWTPLIYPPKLGKKYKEIDRSARSRYFSVSGNAFSNNFEKLAVKLLARNIPTVFFEGLTDLIESAQKTYPKKMTKFITANPNSLGELVKSWV